MGKAIAVLALLAMGAVFAGAMHWSEIVKDKDGFNIPAEYRSVKRMLDSDTGSNVVVPCNPNIIGVGGCNFIDPTGANVNPSTGAVNKGANANYASAGTPSGAAGNVDYPLTDPNVAPPVDGSPYGMHITPESTSDFIISWQASASQVGRYYTVPNLQTDAKCTTAMPNVRLGTASGLYSMRVMAQCVRFVRDYSKAAPTACPSNTSLPCYNYLSPYIFHARVTGLLPGQTYYYVVGDSSYTPNSTRTRDGILNLPASEKPNVIIQPGDFTYADNYAASFPDYETCNGATNPGGSCVGSVNQKRWDTFLKLYEPLYSMYPMIHVAGNHELEGGAGCFVSGNGAVWYPTAPTASTTLSGQTIPWPTVDFGPMNPCFQSYNFRFPHPFTTTWGDMSAGSHYHGMDYGPIHVVSINNYVPFGAGTPQYLWFTRHMQTVDRSKTPWLIVQFHAAPYHTYFTHYKEMECFLSIYEPLFLSWGVDIVISGHVHAYERTHPMYQYQLHPCGPIYLTLGDAGNNEGPYRSGVEEKIDPTGKITNLTFCEVTTAPGNINAAHSPLDVGISPFYQRMVHPPGCVATSWQLPYGKNGETTGLEPNLQDPTRFWCPKSQPKWSAHRDPSFGFATITLLNDTTALFKWHRNIDVPGVLADSTTITRPAPGTCFQEAPPSAPPTCAATDTESCGTSVFANPTSATLSVNFASTVRLTSITMWNEPAAAGGAFAPPALYQSPTQLEGFDIRVRDGPESASCGTTDVPPATKFGYYGVSLMCDVGRSVDIVAPNIARSAAQQSSTLNVRVCVANSLPGPRNMTVFLQQ